VALTVVAGHGRLIFAQAAVDTTETVSQRNTIGTLSAAPLSNVRVGDPVNFSYWLQTGGAAAPTTETVQFFDGTNQIGTAQSIAAMAAANLVPYAQVDTTNGWGTTGTAPVVTPSAVPGADGSTGTGTTVAFPDTTAGTSGVAYLVPSGTSYAGQTVTFSVWVESATPVTLQLQVTDQPQVAASQSAPCLTNTTWTRCFVTYSFPAGSGTGFAVYIMSSSAPAQSVNVWGAQFEQAAAPGPFVSTIGVGRPVGGQAGTVTFPYSDFLSGSHSITVQYAGDANFVGSTSNVVAFAVTQGASTTVLTDSPVGTSVYGTAVVLTAQVTGPS